MPKVNIDHKSPLAAPEAFMKIKVFFETDQDIRRLDPKMTCTFIDASLSGKANGSQFKADIIVKADGEGSLILVVVDLPLLLAPFKAKVQETISKKLNKYLT